MRRNLIIADGIVAKRFLEQAGDVKSRYNEFFVVYQDETILPTIKPANFTYFNFDPTSHPKLSSVLKNDVTDIFIVLKSKNDALIVFESIRKEKKNIKITMLDLWGIALEDRFLTKIDTLSLLSQKLIERLPGVPVTPKDVGLGIGEIVEVSIPFSSSYVYRFIGSIEQRNWKIVGIYRDGKLIIARDHHVIQPNDSLLIIGEPNILKTVYNGIKEELGQFPSPFGANLYVYMDFSILSKKRIEKNIEDILYLNSIVKNKKIFVRIINPNNFALLDKLRELETKTTSIEIDYFVNRIEECIQGDIKQFNIGAIVTDRSIFSERKNQKLFYKLSLPILKLGDEKLESCTKTIVILNDIFESEKISSVVFDISKQLNASISLLSYDIDENDKEKIIEHYENLSKIFGKKINITELKDKNPLLALRKEEGIFHVLPFSRDILRRKIYTYFSTDIESSYFILDRFNQLFVPINKVESKVL